MQLQQKTWFSILQWIGETRAACIYLMTVHNTQMRAIWMRGCETSYTMDILLCPILIHHLLLFCPLPPLPAWVCDLCRASRPMTSSRTIVAEATELETPLKKLLINFPTTRCMSWVIQFHWNVYHFVQFLHYLSLIVWNVHNPVWTFSSFQRNGDTAGSFLGHFYFSLIIVLPSLKLEFWILSWENSASIIIFWKKPAHY